MGGSPPGQAGRGCSPRVTGTSPHAAGLAEPWWSKGGEGGLARKADISAPAFCYRWEFRHFLSPRNY